MNIDFKVNVKQYGDMEHALIYVVDGVELETNTTVQAPLREAERIAEEVKNKFYETLKGKGAYSE